MCNWRGHNYIIVALQRCGDEQPRTASPWSRCRRERNHTIIWVLMVAPGPLHRRLRDELIRQRWLIDRAHSSLLPVRRLLHSIIVFSSSCQQCTACTRVDRRSATRCTTNSMHW